jgi:hypothetical protein
MGAQGDGRVAFLLTVTNIQPQSPYLIYALVDPRTKVIRYVGKSTSGLKRPKRHLQPWILEKEKQTRRVKWIKSLLSAGVTPEIEVLREASSPRVLG